MSKKIISVILALTTIVWLSGIAMLVPAQAAVTVNEGDLIRGPDGVKVYIVNNNGYKRHIFNPAVFGMYKHFTWASIKDVSQSVLDSYKNSDLYRAAGDPKVYSLEEVSEASGNAIKHWLDMTADQFVAKGYNWNQVFIVNATERDYYSTGSPLTYDGSIITGDVTVVTQDTVSSMVVPLKASDVQVMKFKVTSSAATTLTSLTVQRKGVGSYTDFEYLYLYEGSDRLTNAKNISSDTDKATFAGLNISLAAGASKIFTIKADMDTGGAGAGNLDYFQLTALSAGSLTVGGLPINGPQVSISASTGATLTITSSGFDPSDPNIGTNGAIIGKFQINTVANEKIAFKQITVTQSGTADLDNITNWKLYYGNDLLSTGVISGDHVKFVLDTPYIMEKGASRLFDIKGDLGAGNKNAETVVLYLEETTDLLCTGQSYGYGAYITNSFSSGNSVALLGGDFTVGFNGPTTATLAKGAQDVNLFDFTLNSIQDVTVRNLYANIYHSSDITAAYAGNYITDIKVVDKDTGNTILGPVDISSFTDSGGAYASYTFTEDFDMNAGKTRNFKVTADLSTSLAAGVYYFKLGSVGSSYIFSSTDIKDRNASGAYLTTIIPATPIQGNNMTVASASLTVALASTPVSDTVVKSAQNVEAVGLILTAGTGSDVKVTSLKVTASVDADADTTYASAVEGGIYAYAIFSSVSLYDGTTLLGTAKTFNTSGEATFSNLTLTIPAGTSKKLTVKGNVASTAPDGSSDVIKVDVKDVSADIVAQDPSGNSVSSTSSDYPNGGSATAATVGITVSSSGTLYVYPASDKPVAAIVVAGTNDVSFSKFKFTGVDEAFTVTKVTFDNASSGYDDAIVQVKVTYTNQSGLSVTKTGTLSSGEVTISGMDFYVPKDGDAYLTVKADLASISQTTSGDAPALNLSRDRTNDDEFEALGISSQTTLDDDNPYVDGSLTDDSCAGNAMTVRKSYVTITTPTVAPATYNNATAQTVYKFRATATGGSADLYELDFNVTTSGAPALSSWDLYNITEGTAGNWACTIAGAVVTCTASAGDSIAAGGYEDFKLYATVASSDIDDYISTYLVTTDWTTGAVANAAAGSVASSPNIVWSDVSATPHSVSSSDWTNGYLINDSDAYGGSQTTYYPIQS